MSKQKQTGGVIKQILKDHFCGFWKMHYDLIPARHKGNSGNCLKPKQKGLYLLGFQRKKPMSGEIPARNIGASPKVLSYTQRLI